MLSTLEKMIFLKGVSFFEDMTVDQLRALASVCKEKIFAEDEIIFNEGNSGGTLYIVVSGRVRIEQKHKISGKRAQLGLLEMRAYFGEDNLFDNIPTTTAAIADQDTLTLCLSHKPLILLLQQQPDIALRFLKVLGQRIRDIDQQMAELSQHRSREVHKVFDRLD